MSVPRFAAREDSAPMVKLDRNALEDRKTPRWSETRFFCGWSPENAVGLYIHTGRFPGDVDLWWVHLAAYLPHGQLAVERFWCRNRATAGVRSDNFDVEMTETGWRSTYDSVGQLTDREALTRAPRGCSAPSVRLGWDVTATAASPEWDMFAGATGLDFAKDLHVQGTFTLQGTLQVGNDVHHIDGVAFKDHSSGTRSFDTWSGHRFLVGLLPDRAVHAATIMREGAVPATIGCWYLDNRTESLLDFDAPLMTNLQGEPDVQVITLASDSQTLRLHAEIVHALPITISEENDNFNGIDWEMDGDPMVMVESIVRLTTEEGAVGYAFFERSARRSGVPRI